MLAKIVVLITSFCIIEGQTTKDKSYKITIMINSYEVPLGHEFIRVDEHSIMKVIAMKRAIEIINKNKTILPGINLESEMIQLLYDEPGENRSNTLWVSNDWNHPASFHLPIFGRVPSRIEGWHRYLTDTNTAYVSHFLITSAKVKNRKNYTYRHSETDYDTPSKNYRLRYFVRVIYDILKGHNWNDVLLIQSEDFSNDQKTSKLLEEYFLSQICIVNEFVININDPTDDNWCHNLRKLSEEVLVNIVIIFCYNDELSSFFDAIAKHNLTDRFTFIIGKNFIDNAGLTQESTVKIPPQFDAVLISENLPNISDFLDYYKSWKPWNEQYCLFRTFWVEKFNCNCLVDWGCKPYAKRSVEMNPCIGNESLSTPDPAKVPVWDIDFIMKAVWAIAHKMNEDTKEMKMFHAKHKYALYEFMFRQPFKEFSFFYKNELVRSDENSFLIPSFRIDHFSKKYGNESLIGEWKNGYLNLNQSKVERSSTSRCHATCSSGYREYILVVPTYVLQNRKLCLKCPEGERPNKFQTACAIPRFKRDWTEPATIMVIIFGAIGIIITLITICIFIKYRNTPIVKASSREVCYLILFSMLLAHTVVPIILMNPSTINCALSRTLPGIALTMTFAGLYIKTHRIASILVISERKFPKRKFWFMSMSAQVGTTLCCVVIETIICCTMLIINPPAPASAHSLDGHPTFFCSVLPIDVLLPSGFIVFLHILCIWYAIKIRNVPANFNEAKFIGFAILIYNMDFIFRFFLQQYSQSNFFFALTISMCTTLTASMTLIFLFFPKLYIIIFKPEKNVRSLFITNKHIRTHIGANVGPVRADAQSIEPSIYTIPDQNTELQVSSFPKTVAIQTILGGCREMEKVFNTNEISSVRQRRSSPNDVVSLTDNNDIHNKLS